MLQCPECDAYLKAGRCQICNWTASKTGVPAKDRKKSIPVPPQSPSQEERMRGKAELEMLIKSLSSASPGPKGDCPCGGFGHVRRSRSKEAYYMLCIKCGRRTAKHSSQGEAREAWEQGNIQVSTLPWHIEDLELSRLSIEGMTRIVGLMDRSNQDEGIRRMQAQVRADLGWRA